MSKPIKFSFSSNKPTAASGGGGGLYAGIAFNAGDEDDSATAEASDKDNKDNNNHDNQLSGSVGQTAPKEKEKSQQQAWSAALAFAPTVRKQQPRRPNAQVKAPPPATLQSSSKPSSTYVLPQQQPNHQGLRATPIKSSTFQESNTASTSNSNKNPPPPPRSILSSISSSVPELNIDLPDVLEAPPMEVEGFLAPPPPVAAGNDDVNGFLQSEAGRKSVKDDRKGKKGRKKKRDTSSFSFQSAYVPSRPIEYNEWKSYVAYQRQERRRRIYEEDRRRNMSSSDYSDYYDEDESEEDDRDRRWGHVRKQQFYAPPKDYDENTPASAEQDSSTARTSPVAVNKEETGDEAYQRRVLMSKRSFSPPNDDPQQQQQHQAQRSQITIQQSFVPAQPSTDTQESSTPSSSSNVPADAEMRARAVAEKFAKLAGGAGVDMGAKANEMNADNDDPSKGFAEKLMARYGWKEGQGLGANESGITTPISVEVNVPVENKKKAKGKEQKQQHQQQQESHALPPTSTFTNAPVKGRGNIVSEHSTEEKKARLERYGEPSCVIVLTNMVTLDEVDDEELPGEIADEAKKHGKVERCFVRPISHTGPDPLPESEAVRVFVKFDGLVGAWNAVKEFDGRYFAGRAVRARFFNERLFDNGYYDVPM